MMDRTPKDSDKQSHLKKPGLDEQASAGSPKTTNRNPSEPRPHDEARTIDIPPEFGRTGYRTIGSDDGFITVDRTNESSSLPAAVGKYRLIRELGRGAFGVVYLAKDDDIDRQVAIKLSLVEDAEFQRRLMVEASKVARVAGEHIVQVLHVDRTEFGAVYIVQQFIDGCTLGSLLRSDASITPGQAAILIYQIALGLKSAHQHDVLHRDLKPDNILLEKTGMPYIVDFGIAISEDEQLGRNRELAGTPPYMSPEQIKGRVDFMDARSDIWALGVIFYELLTRKLPFTGRNRKELTEQICDRDPKPVQQYSPDTLSEDFNAVFRRCCAKEPADRYSTVDELAEAMRDLIHRFATIEDVDNPLGLGFRGATSTAKTTRNLKLAELVTTGLETNATTSNRTKVSSLHTTAKSTYTTSDDRNKGYLLQIGTALAVACIVVVALVIVDWMRKDPGSEQSSQIDNASSVDDLVKESESPRTPKIDPDLVVYKPESGARLVAATGIANYRTIQAAINDSRNDAVETIKIAPGYYKESLTLSKPVRLVAADLNRQPELSSNDKPIITVDFEGGTVFIENLVLTKKETYEDANGATWRSKFNLIDVKSGTLGMKGCKLQRTSFGPDDTYNAVKVGRNAEVDIADCDFSGEGGFAVSGASHKNIRVSGCKFECNGIQTVEGPGLIRDSIFSGDLGVQAQRSGDTTVEVVGCKFKSNGKFSVNATEGGVIVCESNQYLSCVTALRVTAENEAKALVGRIGSIRAEGEVFEQCLVAVSLSGGQVSLREGCRIESAETGVIVEGGTFVANDLEIVDCERGLYALKDADKVSLDRVTIKNCRTSGAEFERCKEVLIRNVSIIDCDEFCLYLASGKPSIDGLSVQGSEIGIVLSASEATSISLNSLNVFDCKYGIHCQPEDFVDFAVELKDSKLGNCSEVCIYADNRTKMVLSNVVFEGVKEGKRPYLAVSPAIITVLD